MTEAEWLACTNPLKMSESLPLLQRVGRKKSLCVAAICRTIDGIFHDEDARAESVLLLESDAEGWQGQRAADRSMALKMNLLDEKVVVYEKPEQVWIASILRCIFGNPFRPITISPAVLAWNDAVVIRLAQAAYEERHLPAGTLDNSRLAVLADALEEAGCTSEDILDHLRGPGPHVRGCWSVDLCLGKS